MQTSADLRGGAHLSDLKPARGRVRVVAAAAAAVAAAAEAAPPPRACGGGSLRQRPAAPRSPRLTLPSPRPFGDSG